MKRIILASILLISFIVGAKAQISVNVNLGLQPNWGPVGYDRVEYYYLPEYEAYYYVPSKRFYYQNGNSWVNASRLPSRFGTINLFNTYKVVINEPRPYMRHIDYRNKYDRNRGWKAPKQVILRDNRNYRDERFRNDRDNDHRENGKGHGKGKNKRGGDRDD